MIVAKFGGTSVQDAQGIRRTVTIVDAALPRRPLVVVSALAGVTRALLGLGAQAAAEAEGVAAPATGTPAARGAYTPAASGAAGHDAPGAGAAAILAAIESRHRGILEELALAPGEHRAAAARLDALFAELGRRLADLAGGAAYDARAQDGVISFGERLATTLWGAAARTAGVPARNVDAAEIVRTDSRFRSARPRLREIERRAGGRLAPLLQAGEVPVVEGFIGADAEGAPTTMGFEASDLSASLLGAALGAEEVQIWTDVPGMLSTGHPAVAAPRVVPRLTFTEARELALFGAKVLHPDSIEPARRRGIPVRILHSRDPEAPGTWITAGGERDAGNVKSIAVTEDLGGAAVRAALGGGYRPARCRGRAVVCLVGERIAADGELAARLRRCLAGIDDAVELAPEASSSRVALVMPAALVAVAVERLHRELFEVDRDADRGVDRDADRGVDRDADSGVDRDADRGVDRDADRGVDRDADLGTGLARSSAGT